ncbi:hypothetical protein OKHIL_76770 [Mycolicibacterium mageritense]|nr:hypothetical protein MTY414_77460 [Mycolicibacterium mageritense]
MVRVQDPAGEIWEVKRAWFLARYTNSSVGSYYDDIPVVSTAISVILLPFVLVWPFWFAAKFVGMPWKIVVRQGNTEVHREKVHGWKASKLRTGQLAAELEHSGESVIATQPPPPSAPAP